MTMNKQNQQIIPNMESPHTHQRALNRVTVFRLLSTALSILFCLSSHLTLELKYENEKVFVASQKIKSRSQLQLQSQGPYFTRYVTGDEKVFKVKNFVDINNQPGSYHLMGVGSLMDIVNDSDSVQRQSNQYQQQYYLGYKSVQSNDYQQYFVLSGDEDSTGLYTVERSFKDEASLGPGESMSWYTLQKFSNADAQAQDEQRSAFYGFLDTAMQNNLIQVVGSKFNVDISDVSGMSYQYVRLVAGDSPFAPKTWTFGFSLVQQEGQTYNQMKENNVEQTQYKQEQYLQNQTQNQIVYEVKFNAYNTCKPDPNTKKACQLTCWQPSPPVQIQSQSQQQQSQSQSCQKSVFRATPMDSLPSAAIFASRSQQAQLWKNEKYNKSGGDADVEVKVTSNGILQWRTASANQNLKSDKQQMTRISESTIIA